MKSNFEENFIKQFKENKIIAIKHAITDAPIDEIRQYLNGDIKEINLCEKKTFNEYNKLEKKEYFNYFDKNIIIFLESQLIKNFEELILWCLKEQSEKSFIFLFSSIININEDVLEFLKLQKVFLQYQNTFVNKIAKKGIKTSSTNISNELIYGSYIDILDKHNLSIYFENKLNYIIKILTLCENKINKKEELIQVLRYLAMKNGENVSYLEIGLACNIDNETVEKYLSKLAELQILILIKSFYHSNKYEIKKGNCIYFNDIGLRNFLINNFQELNKRFDVDFLWKNWFISERFKINNGNEFKFWLTHTKQKIDLIEIDLIKNSIYAFVFQFDKKSRKKIPELFKSYYPEISVKLVHNANFLPFLI